MSIPLTQISTVDTFAKYHNILILDSTQKTILYLQGLSLLTFVINDVICQHVASFSTVWMNILNILYVRCDSPVHSSVTSTPHVANNRLLFLCFCKDAQCYEGL